MNPPAPPPIEFLHGSGQVYVDRGDPAAGDVDLGDLTLDDAWHMLDLSAVVPQDAAGKPVHLRVGVEATIPGRYLLVRRLGNVNIWNAIQVASQMPNVLNLQDAWIVVDELRRIEYLGSSTGLTIVALTVAGWMTSC